MAGGDVRLSVLPSTLMTDKSEHSQLFSSFGSHGESQILSCKFLDQNDLFIFSGLSRIQWSQQAEGEILLLIYCPQLSLVPKPRACVLL